MNQSENRLWVESPPLSTSHAPQETTTAPQPAAQANISPILVYPDEAARLRTRYLPGVHAIDPMFRAVQRSLCRPLYPRNSSHHPQAETAKLDEECMRILVHLSSTFLHEAATARRAALMVKTNDGGGGHGDGVTRRAYRITLAMMERGWLEVVRNGVRLDGRPLDRAHPMGYRVGLYSPLAFAAACLHRSHPASKESDLQVLQRMLDGYAFQPAQFSAATY